MAKKGNRPSSGIYEDLQYIKGLQEELSGKNGAICLAANQEGMECRVKVIGKCHTISEAKYLTQISSGDNKVLWPLPVDATHLTHQTKKDGRIARQRIEKITHVKPKEISIGDASAWYFACQEHDQRFGPIDNGITFPAVQEYVLLKTEDTTETNKNLENALFLLAYRSILSTICILKGARKMLHQHKIAKGNHRHIQRKEIELYEMYGSLMTHKNGYDRRFSGNGEYNMVHHLMPMRPHTRIALSYFEGFMARNILPDNGIHWFIVSHSADESAETQQQIKDDLRDLSEKLADSNNKKPFIDTTIHYLNTFIAPADYYEWKPEEQEQLEKAAAKYMRSLSISRRAPPSPSPQWPPQPCTPTNPTPCKPMAKPPAKSHTAPGRKRQTLTDDRSHTPSCPAPTAQRTNQ